MQKIEWITLKRLKDEDNFKEVLKVGERFLTGSKLIEQNPQPGDRIWYFQVIKIDETVEYMPVSDVLEKEHVLKEFTIEEEK